MVSLCGFAMAACVPPHVAPTTSLPIAAPAGASNIVAEFVEVCSAAIKDGIQIGGLLAERGWQVSGGPDDVDGLVGILGAEHPELDLTLQLIPLDYPHLKGTGCSMSGYNVLNITAADLTGLNDLPGFPGSMRDYGRSPDAMTMGRWSAIAPDGEPITVNATFMADAKFLNLNMNHTRRVQPDVESKQ